MGRGERHVFRFFTDAVGAPNARIELDAFDAHHARVLHGARADAPVELVDGDGHVWHATFTGPTGELLLGELLDTPREPRIDLVALVTVGGRVDELVAGAVQAGATRVVPVVRAARDRARIDARADRLARIATTAAKQAKRAGVPPVTAAIELDGLRRLPAGIVVDPDADATLHDALHGAPADAPVRLLVGSAEGFPEGLVDELASSGWRRARLGPTILRSELAAAVSVAIAAMLAPRT